MARNGPIKVVIVTFPGGSLEAPINPFKGPAAAIKDDRLVSSGSVWATNGPSQTLLSLRLNSAIPSDYEHCPQ